MKNDTYTVFSHRLRRSYPQNIEQKNLTKDDWRSLPAKADLIYKTYNRLISKETAPRKFFMEMFCWVDKIYQRCRDITVATHD